jgi:hypothetical protein
MKHMAPKRKTEPDRYLHLTGKQKAKIREAAARVYCAHDGAHPTPQQFAENIVSHWSIAECLSSFRDSAHPMRGLGFDPETGKGP